jgi:adenylosuccinate lyase
VIPRYTTPEMRALWSDRTKFDTWLEIEILAAEVQAEHGLIPPDAAREIRERARVTDVDRIHELEERETRHDVVAFLRVVGETIGESARYLHRGLGSSDVVDTATSVVLTRAADLLLTEMDATLRALTALADAHRGTLMAGRTHGVQAEPMTFGAKVAVWLAEMRRNRERVIRVREIVRVGKISGEVGNYAHLPPWAEAHICARLGLAVAEASSQVLQRDRHAEYVGQLAVVGGTLEKIATEIRSLQRTEILELEEPFAVGQTGSSAMPHKRNPILCERIVGLARMLRGNALAALESQALWGERDISHSSVERIVLSGSTSLLHYMLRKLNGVLAGLNVYPDNMRRNLERMGGLVYSQRVLLSLIEHGMSREAAYRAVQNAALAVWQDPNRSPDALKRRLLDDPAVAAVVSTRDLDACFDPAPYLAQTDEILARAGVPRREDVPS